MPHVVSIAEATRALNLRSENYVRRLVKAGTLRAELVDGAYDVDPASVAEYRRSVELKQSSASFEERCVKPPDEWLEAV